ncbi:IS3 family transposase [Aeribacillus pallidus]|uniref:IS3 family transposase n=1 Tax=Aeribacillus pallidus TaxID=33936 RepID=UPI000B92BC96
MKRFRTRKEAKQAIFEYIECFSNRKRSHSALGYVSPCEFEAAYYVNQRNDGLRHFRGPDGYVLS